MSALCDLLHILFVSFLANARSGNGLSSKSLGQDIVEIVKFSVFFLPKVEEVAECEVTECHEIADGLHDIPTRHMEGANEDER